MKVFCVDSGFLIGLYDETDQYHEKANQYFSDFLSIGPNQLVIPWPTIYETVSTRMVRNRRRMETFERDWKRLRAQEKIALLDDAPFRERAIEECFVELAKPARNYRMLSVTDRVLRNILSDVGVRIDVFITFNPGDFLDVCRASRREMVS